MVNFGFIGEGKTDFYVIRRLLFTYYNPNILIRSLSPSIEDDKQVSFGGWQKVFEYCKSPDLPEFLKENDQNYLIIHVDTDKCHEKGFEILHKREDVKGEQLILDVIDKFWNKIFHKDLNKEKFEHKIVFAITIKKVECWLISAYTKDSVLPKNINNCENSLQDLLNKEKSKIVLSRRNHDDYDTLARKFSKTDLKKKPKNNIGFKHFIESLPKIEDENQDLGSLLI